MYVKYKWPQKGPQSILQLVGRSFDRRLLVTLKNATGGVRLHAPRPYARFYAEIVN